MKKILLLVSCILSASLSLHADEGMWLPSLIAQRIQDMQSKGFKLSAEDIYSINQASLKDAVVLFGTGCTGELVSGKGLLFTNHHCGYSAIQKLSSVEHDYLKDGYWAMDSSQELPAEGLTVSFLERMEDVTGIILKDCSSDMTEEERAAAVKEASAALVKQATADGKGLKASVEALYYGNQYFLFVYRVYNDIRFVGAPPSSIGKFGGDTDNWMWPRHTGDFSIFRIYADKDNNPAAYSEDNVPYKPKRFFKISTAGVQEGDFTFIYGYPGSTREYIHSAGVDYISEISDPHKIALRTLRLDIQKKYMSESQAVRIQYSSKNASVSNAWKKWQGEMKGIRKMNTVEQKRSFEAGFEKWAEGSSYEGLTGKLAAVYERMEPYNFAYEYYTETIRAVELIQTATNWPKIDAQQFYKDYYLPIDKESFAVLADAFRKDVPLAPDCFKQQYDSFGSGQAWAEELFSKSVFRSAEALAAADSLTIENDPARLLGKSCLEWYNSEIRPILVKSDSELNLLYRDYMRAQMEYDSGRTFYPDANLTLRVAYGAVKGYSPSDGIYFKPSSTLKGIMEKDNPDIFDYNIPQVLRDLYAKGGYEDVPVCFIATNHTSGGNSGSPVINSDGDLIGLNFDRVWEGTMSDVVFDPEICRNICLDIRYLLFVVREIGQDDYILDELTFTE